MSIGKTIHALRKENKMTLLELADKSGVALATLSRMENAKMTGTLESHMKICDALGIALPNFTKTYTSQRKPSISRNRDPAPKSSFMTKSHRKRCLPQRSSIKR